MIELFYADTPNGKKISIMLEEIQYPYKITVLDLKKGDQFNSKFRSISPFGKIPVITDHKNNRVLINQWLVAQVAYVGPLLGQHHQFHHYTPGKSKWGEDRYFKIAKTIYKDLDERLEKSKFLAGNEFTIADIATFPWIARHPIHDIGLKNFINLSRWYNTISKREAVIKGFDGLKKGEKIPKI